MHEKTNLIENIEIDLEREYLTDIIYLKEMEFQEMEELAQNTLPAKITVLTSKKLAKKLLKNGTEKRRKNTNSS